MPTLSAVILKGNDASKPASAAPGSLYFATDTAKVYRFNGATWDDVTSGGGGSGTLGTQNGGFSAADEIPGSPNALDDEFNGSSFDTVKWTVHNPESTTFTEGNGLLSMVHPFSSLDHITLITQPAPAAPWQFDLKISDCPPYPGTANYAGIGMSDSSGKLVAWSLSAGYGITVDYWTNLTGTFNTRAFQNTSANWIIPPLYLRVKNDGTNLNFYWSKNGLYWTLMSTKATNAFLTAGPTLVGIFAGGKLTGTDSRIDADWFRRTA